MKKIVIALFILLFSFSLFSQVKENLFINDVKIKGKLKLPKLIENTASPDSLLRLNPDGSVGFVRTANGPTIYYAAGDTSNHPIPTTIGDIFIDTTAGKLYFAKGVTRGSWVIAN